jgi:hypothetical protein
MEAYMKSRITVLLLFCFFVLNGFGFSLDGSGKAMTQLRNIGSFEELEIDISADTIITKGDKAACEITADDNIIPLIITKIEGNRLIITSDRNYSTRTSIKIKLQTPKISSVILKGSGDITVKNISKEKLEAIIKGSGNITGTGEAKTLTVEISGSGDVNLTGLKTNDADISIAGTGNFTGTGEAKNLKIDISGSGHARLAELKVNDADIRIMGSGNATINVIDSLTTKIMGSGDVIYSGSPKTVNSSVLGSGSIIKK